MPDRVRLTVVNSPKLGGIIVAMALLATLFALDRLSESAFVGMFGALVGYLVGNGVAAKNHDPVTPVIGDRDR